MQLSLHNEAKISVLLAYSQSAWECSVLTPTKGVPLLDQKPVRAPFILVCLHDAKFWNFQPKSQPRTSYAQALAPLLPGGRTPLCHSLSILWLLDCGVGSGTTHLGQFTSSLWVLILIVVKIIEPSVVVLAYNPSTWEVEFKAILDFIGVGCYRTNKKNWATVKRYPF